ncbi:MAG: DUF134 domain-containing protein [Candidatus Thorarchaeota archaeon]|nr:DUF134 domain-containing protein [Candidatus Thorarchaeota archaeon]
MHRRRRGGRGRFPIQPEITNRPFAKRMIPEPIGYKDSIYIDLAEAEVLRLVDLEGMYQEQAGVAMGVSRGTIWRLLVSAREKVTRSIYEGRPLVIGQAQEEES